jgi:hypothetical protein
LGGFLFLRLLKQNKIMYTQAPNTQIPFSVILGGTPKEALESLAHIKDAMGAALALHAENELALDQRTLDHCRIFYMAADYQYCELLEQEEEGLQNRIIELSL